MREPHVKRRPHTHFTRKKVREMREHTHFTRKKVREMREPYDTGRSHTHFTQKKCVKVRVHANSRTHAKKGHPVQTCKLDLNPVRTIVYIDLQQLGLGLPMHTCRIYSRSYVPTLVGSQCHHHRAPSSTQYIIMMYTSYRRLFIVP